MDSENENVDIDISISCDSWRESIPSIEEICRRSVLAALTESLQDIPRAEISLVLADNHFIQRLNQQYRNIDRPTNVLAFPGDDISKESGEVLYDGNATAPLLLGDIVVAYETAALEAQKEDKELADHLSHLVVHGTLHLLGYDHKNDADTLAMETLELKSLATLGVQNP